MLIFQLYHHKKVLFSFLKLQTNPLLPSEFYACYFPTWREFLLYFYPPSIYMIPDLKSRHIGADDESQYSCICMCFRRIGHSLLFYVFRSIFFRYNFIFIGIICLVVLRLLDGGYMRTWTAFFHCKISNKRYAGPIHSFAHFIIELRFDVRLSIYLMFCYFVQASL